MPSYPIKFLFKGFAGYYKYSFKFECFLSNFDNLMISYGVP